MYKRAFLNKPRKHSGAYIIAQCDKEETYVKISDCSRVVTLDFGGWDDTLENDLYKLQILTSTLEQFRAALEKKYEKLKKMNSRR